MKPFQFFSLTTLGTIGLLLGSFPAQATKEEGKFHLIYLVTVPNLDKKAWIEQKKKEDYDPVTAAAVAVGAEVDIEPGLLTDGVRIVFAFDYCRRHYPEQNGTVRRQHEEQVAKEKVAPQDRADLERYCKGKEFSLTGAQYTVRDNSGVSLTLSDAQFTPLGWAHPGYARPERFAAKITRIEGTLPEKLPLAQQARQPYVFLMSRNRALLERMVPVARPTHKEKKTLLDRLEQYKQKRRKEDPFGREERCGLYVYDGQAAKPYDASKTIWLRKLSDEPLSTAETIFTDVDNDGRSDLVANLSELGDYTMVRVYPAKHVESCALKMNDLNRSPIFRPIIIIKTRDCVYAYGNRYEQAVNSYQRIALLRGSPEVCRHHNVLRFYEEH
jgi:hypothetical protein